MLTAGSGPALLFLHGAGTWHGFDFALPWAKTHRVLVPVHPGWEGSGDHPSMTAMHDYVMHYLMLIDQLGLQEVDLAGLSMGARMAAQFAAEHRRRVRKLVLVAPAGLDVPGRELADFSKIPPAEILAYLTEDVPLLARRAPANPGAEWLAARDTEGRKFFQLLPSIKEETFTRWLHRLTMPGLLIWGDKDRTTPIEQAARWREYAPGLEFVRVAGAGHLLLDERPEIVERIGAFLS